MPAKDDARLRSDDPPPSRVSDLPIAGPPRTLYDAVGGEPTFRRLVARFYEEVAADLEILRPLYPAADLGPAEDRFGMFLIQYWGGPQTYTEQRGHPRLRMRHSPFAIGPAQRDAWLRAMRVALDDSGIPDPYARQLTSYFESTAEHMINVRA
ncbi:MAG TPA: globin [Solirubrobacteraceae bacterium]|nr:globin [Solirubrobacteraceae bacterium]